VGWRRGLGTEDPAFAEGFKFYMFDDGPFNMEDADRCMRKYRGAPPPDAPNAMDAIDRALRVNEREYLTELFLLPALRAHPMRTLVKKEAQLFVIGYANALARYAKSCRTVAYGQSDDEWDNKVGHALEMDAFFKKNGGRDFLFLNSRYKTDMSQPLHTLLDSGPIVATFDRFSGRLHGYWRNAWTRGSVIVMPYVSSVALDHHHAPPRPKNPKRTYYFRGNMHRWNGERHYLPALAKHLTGADFAEVSFVAFGKGSNFEPVLNATAFDMRESSVCPSPEGDTPTSLRLFEALVAGCVPVVVGQANLTAFTLPFPSLIDYDSLALFSLPFKEMVARKDKDGLQEFARVLESFAGPDAVPDRRARLESMRAEGVKVYERHFSFFRNPQGVTTSMLFEAWVLLQRQGILQGPHTP